MHPYVYCGYLSYWFYFAFCKKFCLSVQQGHGSDVLSVPALCHTVVLEALGFWGVELVAALGLSCPLFPGGRCVSPTSSSPHLQSLTHSLSLPHVGLCGSRGVPQITFASSSRTWVTSGLGYCCLQAVLPGTSLSLLPTCCLQQSEQEIQS